MAGRFSPKKIARVVVALLLVGIGFHYYRLQSNEKVAVDRDHPSNYKGSSKYQMHGILGRRSDGTPGYKLSPCPTNFKIADELRNNGFFGRLSDCIPLDRNITDGRHKMCPRVQYDLESLPQTSVIFVFYNEHFSVLMRSVHSVLNRTPPQLLKEIILVDDGSDKPWLGKQLEDYIALLPKVRLLRNEKRSGLVIARLNGINAARAETFTVLDSHIEVEEGWCEPLMQRIKGDRRRVLMPQIDGVDQEVGTAFALLYSRCRTLFHNP